MDQGRRSIPEGDRVTVGGDLHGHEGISSEANVRSYHDDWAVGETNEYGESVTDVAMACDLSIVNTMVERTNHLVTDKSGGSESQIDFLICGRQQLKEIKNCNVINGESVAAQHSVLVLNW